MPFDGPAADDARAAEAESPARLVVQSGPGVSLSVYLDAVAPDTAYDGDRMLAWEQAALPSRHHAPLRAGVQRVGERMAGCLGAEFTPAPDGSRLTVSVHVCNTPGRGAITTGLEPWAAEAVLHGVRDVARSTTVRDLGAGHLEVRWGWQHAVDSSALGFRTLAAQLVGLLGLPRTATREDAWAAWRRTRDSAKIATLLDGLDAIRAKHPEAGTFRPGASDADVTGLARDLGLALPESLRTVLGRVNGGAFDPRAVPKSPRRTAAEHGSHAWCSLLGVDEIRAAYADLIATHEAYAAVERWDDRWPVRARYRPPDAEPAPWPFVPVCRTLEGQEVLVVAVSGPLGEGPVLDAFHEVGPRDWRVVYDGFADLFEAFVAGAGEVRVLGGLTPTRGR